MYRCNEISGVKPIETDAVPVSEEWDVANLPLTKKVAHSAAQ